MAKKQNAYEKLNTRKNKKVMDEILSSEETYWTGAGLLVLVTPFISVIDGGFGLAVAYGAKKMYEKNKR